MGITLTQLYSKLKCTKIDKANYTTFMTLPILLKVGVTTTSLVPRLLNPFNVHEKKGEPTDLSDVKIFEGD